MKKADTFARDSRSLLSEDQLLCAICLEMFTDPVSTSCGHNFCESCLKQYWENAKLCHCPVCDEKFPKKPELKINTALRDVVEHLRKRSDLEKSHVLCDVCTGAQLKALKSCLDCGVTFCKSHLEPHNNVPKLQQHKLIKPVENLQDYICQEHERPLELFCRDDQTCLCRFCVSRTDHRHHNTVSLEEESGLKKIQLGVTQTKIQQMIQDRLKKIKGIQRSVELTKKNSEKEIADSVEVFTALIHLIEESQAELLKVMEKKLKAAERQATDLIKDLEQEITELKWRDDELERLAHTEDHLQVLQIYPSLCRCPVFKNWTYNSTDLHLRVSQALFALQKSLDEEIRRTYYEKMRESKLKRIQMIQEYAVDVTLDPDTAHPQLFLSDNGRQLSVRDTKQDLVDKPERFDTCPLVLGQQGFSSGRFYFEVQVKGKLAWDLGVASESVKRKGPVTLNPENGFWTVVLRNGDKYSVVAKPPVALSLTEKPQKVGVFVDYEEGLVSFYDVETGTHIYSFTGQPFTEKLYPFLSPGLSEKGKNLAPLIISVKSRPE